MAHGIHHMCIRTATAAGYEKNLAMCRAINSYRAYSPLIGGDKLRLYPPRPSVQDWISNCSAVMDFSTQRDCCQDHRSD